MKEGTVLFNDALNTFYIWLYGIRHMVKNHSDSEKGNLLLLLHGLLFLISSKGSFVCTIYRQDSTYTSSEELAGMRNSSVGPPSGIDPTTHCT